MTEAKVSSTKKIRPWKSYSFFEKKEYNDYLNVKEIPAVKHSLVAFWLVTT